MEVPPGPVVRWEATLPVPFHPGAIMSKLLRGLVAGYGAKKLGGGCISTVLVFLLLWWLLGYCNAMR
jgi:hypothetical protein